MNLSVPHRTPQHGFRPRQGMSEAQSLPYQHNGHLCHVTRDIRARLRVQSQVGRRGKCTAKHGIR